MRKIERISAASLVLLLLAPSARAETVTLTTYYPAPSGVYNQMIATGNTYLARDGGSVGLRTVAPTSLLDVNGTAQLRGSPGGLGLVVDSFGNVGINTATPSRALSVEGYALLDSAVGGLIVRHMGTGNGWEVGTLNGGADLTFVGSPSASPQFNAVTFTQAGNVGVGTVSPQAVYNFGPTLEVAGENCGRSGYGDEICVGGDDSGNDGEVDMVSPARNRLGFWNPAQGIHLDLYARNYNAMEGGGFNTISSRRFKTRFRPIAHPLETIARLDGVAFDWKASGKPGLGFIAEDLGKVLPELVTYDAGQAQSVDYTKLVPILVEAVKAQQREIEELKARLQAR